MNKSNEIRTCAGYDDISVLVGSWWSMATSFQLGAKLVWCHIRLPSNLIKVWKINLQDQIKSRAISASKITRSYWINRPTDTRYKKIDRNKTEHR